MQPPRDTLKDDDGFEIAGRSGTAGGPSAQSAKRRGLSGGSSIGLSSPPAGIFEYSDAPPSVSSTAEASDDAGVISIDPPFDFSRSSTPGETPHRKRNVGQGPTHVEQIAASDGLSRQAITKAIVKLLQDRATSGPLAIGLFGRWGSGKSSQIGLVRNEIQKNLRSTGRFRFVEFNAWDHEKCENLTAALAHAIVSALIDGMSILEQYALARKIAKRKRAKLFANSANDFTRICQFVAPLLTIEMAIGLLVFTVAIDQIFLHPIAVPAALLVLLAAAWSTFQKYVATNLSNFFRQVTAGGGGLFSLPDYRSKLGSFYEMRQALSDVAFEKIDQNDDPKAGEYFVLIIDDLDRCNAATVKQMLDSVRVVTNINRMVTIVSIDDKIAYPAVINFFEQFSGRQLDLDLLARDFLAKVFNITISLPGISDADVTTYITKHLFASPTTVKELGRENDGQVPGENFSDAGGEVTQSEVVLFAQLALATGTVNPRKLWRMKQSWLLLRTMVDQENSDPAINAGILRSVFAREAMLSLRTDAKRRACAWAAELDDVPSSPAPAELPKEIADLIKLCGREGRVLWRSVDSVLLPSADT